MKRRRGCFVRVKARLASPYEKTKTGNRLSLALLINRGLT